MIRRNASRETRAGCARCEPLRTARTAVLTMLVAILSLAPARSQGIDPGIAYPSASEASDSKLGSVLIYNVISSSTSTPSTRNTELSITNHHETQATAFRLFFVDGATGIVSRTRLILLQPNQALSMLASVIAPNVEGYAIAVALDDVTGCPISFNHLSGSAAVKLNSGHRAELGAVAVAALYTGTIAGCTSMSTAATLTFDGTQYNRMASTVAIDSFGSTVDGNDGLLVLNRIGGDLTTSVPKFGFVYEASASGGTSFASGVLNDLNPQIRMSTESFLQISNDETAWLTIDAVGAIAGAFLTFNPNAATAPGAFTGGHNLHRLALVTDILTLPVLPATPGFAYPASSEASDNRAGSVLVFPLFTASAATPNSETTSLTLTNTHDTSVDVELFFVSGSTGASNPLATLLLALPPHAPRSVTAGAVAPGFRGYVIAVAVDDSTGCPIAFNHLIGDADVKLNSGHFASLPATAIAALYSGTAPACAAGDASLRFNGVDYNRLPRGLALDNTGSDTDGNFTLFVIDHVGGSLDTSLTPIGTVNGSFYDENGTGSDFNFNAPPQFLGTFAPGLPSGVPTWFEAYPASSVAMVGSTLKFNASAASTASAFTGGHNLHVLTLASDTLALNGPPVDTPTRTQTPPPSATPTNVPPTFTRTRTPTVPLSTPTRTATRTSSATATRTATRTSSAVPSATAAPSATATNPVPSATPTSTPIGPTPTGSISPSPSPTATSQSCVGDCNGNGTVAINELIVGVNIVLDMQPLSACPVFDRNNSDSVTIGELIEGVNNLLNGCSI